MTRRISSNPAIQDRYEAMVAAGESHSIAEMLATRSFPGVMGTDRTFMQGRPTDGAQFDGTPPIVGRAYVKQAEAAGVNVSGKVYSSTLARFPGDPRAWVSGISDVKARCEEQGWGCHGALNIPEPESEPEPEKPYRVAPKIIENEVNQMIAIAPELARKREELTHEVTMVRSGAMGER